MIDDLTQHCLHRYEDLRAQRAMYEWVWEDIARFITPDRGQFNFRFSPGQKSQRFILDSTGQWASEQLANFLYGALTNPAMQWFNLDVYDKDIARRDDVRQYLQLATNHLYSVFNNPRKKFYDNAHEVYNDVVPFGTGIMFLEDKPVEGLSFKARFLYECYLDEDCNSNVDVMFRRFELNARQIIQLFGPDALPDDLRKAADRETGRKFEIIHGIYPREDDVAELSKNRMPYASTYILMEKKSLLRDSGFRRFPVLAPRWTKRSNEVYGRGPGSIALAEVRMLQKMKETTLKGGQKVVDPPLQVPDNTFLSPLNLTPGAINYYTPIFDGEGAKPIITDSRPDFGAELMDREKEAIERAFYVDKLSNSKDSNVEQTKAEVVQSQQERLMLMAPQLGRMNSEFIGPLIEQTYFVERMAGRLPDPPAALQGQPLVVQYKGPLARAQQLQKLQDVTMAIQDLQSLAQVLPEVLDSVDPDGVSQWIFFSYDTPMDCLKPADEVKKQREQRQQQQQMVGALQQAELGSKAVGNVAKLMPRNPQQNALG